MNLISMRNITKEANTCNIFITQIEAAKRIVAREDLKETVAEMFEIAASLDSTSSSTSESLPDNLFLLV